MVVITVDDEWKQRDVLAICEFKAVENKANSYVASLLQKLKSQLDGHHAAHPGAALVFGVVFAVWSPENAQRAGNINGSIELLDNFVFRLKGCIQTAGMSIAADGKFPTIFDKKTTGAIYPIWQRGLAVAIVKA